MSRLPLATPSAGQMFEIDNQRYVSRVINDTFSFPSTFDGVGVMNLGTVSAVDGAFIPTNGVGTVTSRTDVDYVQPDSDNFVEPEGSSNFFADNIIALGAGFVNNTGADIDLSNAEVGIGYTVSNVVPSTPGDITLSTTFRVVNASGTTIFSTTEFRSNDEREGRRIDVDSTVNAAEMTWANGEQLFAAFAESASDLNYDVEVHYIYLSIPGPGNVIDNTLTIADTYSTASAGGVTIGTVIFSGTINAADVFTDTSGNSVIGYTLDGTNYWRVINPMTGASSLATTRPTST